MRRISIALALVLLAAAPAAAEDGELFTVQDPQITESSALLALGDLVITTNDSGDTGRIFALNDQGATVGTTSFGEVQDVEALAPASDTEVWVGDIGDNDAKRKKIVVFRVPIGASQQQVDAPSFDLVYPDKAHDAETLLRAKDGRLYVVTKESKRSLVFAAPAKLDPNGANRLEKVAEIAMMPTDGALTPDGKLAVLRDYTSAQVFSFPDFVPRGKLTLPGQPQGEGLALPARRTALLSTEGVKQPVLQVSLPRRIFKAREASASPSPSTSPTAEASASASSDGVATPASAAAAMTPAKWQLFAGLMVALASLLTLVGLLARRRAR